MNLGSWVRAVAAAVVFGSVAASAGAQGFSSFVVFGDSLSDTGNNALLIGTDPTQVVTGNTYIPLRPYAYGTYSDGPVWASFVGAALGLPAQPSLAGGTNYAFGGATTGGVGVPPSLRRQVSMALDSGGADPNALYVIAGGGNDALDALDAVTGGAPAGRTLRSTARRFAWDVGAMVDELQAAGARRILVWDTPDISLTPAVQAGGTAAISFAAGLVGAMNDALDLRLAGEAGVSVFDVAGLLRSVVASPGDFGLVDASNACGAIVGCDPSTYLFWDGIHPTSAGHRLLGEAIYAAVVPEPASVALWLAGLVALTAGMRRRPAGAPAGMSAIR